VKPEPETDTDRPGVPELGETAICGVTSKVGAIEEAGESKPVPVTMIV
jgi:hypothetical protein